MQALIDSHEKNTGAKVEAAVADSKYGTIDNYVTCHDRKIKAHIPSLEQTQKKVAVVKKTFSQKASLSMIMPKMFLSVRTVKF